MRRFLSVLTLLLVGAVNLTQAQDTHATHQGLTCFFGSLHAHSGEYYLRVLKGHPAH
jgi:hypothetical protein